MHGATPNSGQLGFPRRQHPSADDVPSFVGFFGQLTVSVARNRGLGVAVSGGRVESGRGRALHLDRGRLTVVGIERLPSADVEGAAFDVQGILFMTVVILAIAWI